MEIVEGNKELGNEVRVNCNLELMIDYTEYNSCAYEDEMNQVEMFY